MPVGGLGACAAEGGIEKWGRSGDVRWLSIRDTGAQSPTAPPESNSKMLGCPSTNVLDRAIR